jgi:hypothetical protein
VEEENKYMEPLKPEQKRTILKNSPQAQPGDIQEYERLLSLRFTEDPDQQPEAAPSGFVERMVRPASRDERELRIKELHRKLFGLGEEESESENEARG